MTEEETKEFLKKAARAETQRKRFVQSHLNQLVLATDQIYKLVGLAEDEDDIYWRLKNLHGEENWLSCVGKTIPMKGVLSARDYKQLMEWFEMNDCTKSMSESELKAYRKKFVGTIVI